MAEIWQGKICQQLTQDSPSTIAGVQSAFTVDEAVDCFVSNRKQDLKKRKKDWCLQAYLKENISACSAVRILTLTNRRADLCPHRLVGNF